MFVFFSNRDGNTEIYVMNVDGSGTRRLTSNRSDDYFPSWSADGKYILFTSDRNGETSQLYIMNADGTGQKELLSDTEGDNTHARWQMRRP